ncbi:DUF1861 family protein [Rahnella aquatilis]|uniref:DUF1861 family protein n=1 Tax=Rahnella aquatilis TaxID=34038 RepID=UPI00067439A3|nr:DUF1861 family protein [Rahnella aquatilis]
MSTVETLLRQFHSLKLPVPAGEKISFSGAGDDDVYNLTAPFRCADISVIAARVEPRNSELSQVKFFEFDGVRQCTLLPDAPVFALQDPFFARIGGEFIFGGVSVEPADGTSGRLQWRTVLYRGADMYSLRPFFIGPQGMKDIRPVGLPDGKVLLFTRPQGETGGRGTIGYILLDSLEDLTPAKIAQATLLQGQVAAEEWCGVNAAYVLDGHQIGVLGHVARFDARGYRNYYACSFIFNCQTYRCTAMKIIAERKQFKPGAAKRADLEDVIFPGGLCITESSAPRLYCGTSDCEAQWIEINHPFK